MGNSTDWSGLYGQTRQRVRELAREARLTLCGFSACVDVTLPLHRALTPLRRASAPRALALGAELERRAAAGIGGEIVVDWPQGPAWLDSHCRGDIRVGGTAAQAAVTLGRLRLPGRPFDLARRGGDP